MKKFISKHIIHNIVVSYAYRLSSIGHFGHLALSVKPLATFAILLLTQAMHGVLFDVGAIVESEHCKISETMLQSISWSSTACNMCRHQKYLATSATSGYF